MKIEKPTEKQLKLIMEMNEFSEFPLPKFDGKTKQEASEYISKYLKISHECMNLYEMSH